eukprot:2234915-Rhodomonas_salina.2
MHIASTSNCRLSQRQRLLLPPALQQETGHRLQRGGRRVGLWRAQCTRDEPAAILGGRDTEES